MESIAMDICALSEKLINDLRCGYQASSYQLTITWLDALNECLQSAKIKDRHLDNLFQVMLGAQQRKDHLFYADIIEYELLPYLKRLGVIETTP
ncbi:hypothetical protein [Thalassotalea ganghwensis]